LVTFDKVQGKKNPNTVVKVDCKYHCLLAQRWEVDGNFLLIVKSSHAAPSSVACRHFVALSMTHLLGEESQWLVA
jgi:hypothetical protein